MEYKVFFTDNYIDDTESLIKGYRADVLINDKEGNFYHPFFITIDRIIIEFEKSEVCYLENNLVILHSITKDNILKATEEIHKNMFTKGWLPLTEEQLQTYFYPKENWCIFSI